MNIISFLNKQLNFQIKKSNSVLYTNIVSKSKSYINKLPTLYKFNNVSFCEKKFKDQSYLQDQVNNNYIYSESKTNDNINYSEKVIKKEEIKPDTNKGIKKAFFQSVKPSEEEREKRFKKAYPDPYTQEEFEEIINKEKEAKNNKILTYTMSEENFKRIKKIKWKSTRLYFPLVIFLSLVKEFGLFVKLTSNGKILVTVLDVSLVTYVVMAVYATRNFVKRCYYNFEDKTFEFYKLNMFCKEYLITKKVEELHPTKKNPFTPFLTLETKNKKDLFSMTGLGEYNDYKLFGYMFPSIVPKFIKRNR